MNILLYVAGLMSGLGLAAIADNPIRSPRYWIGLLLFALGTVSGLYIGVMA